MKFKYKRENPGKPPVEIEIDTDEQERLQKDYERTHPPGVDRISGCCDDPQNYPTK